MSRAQKVELAQLLEEKLRRSKLAQGIRTYNGLYDWQRRFNAATKDHIACMLMAANQCVAGNTPISVTGGRAPKMLPLLKTLSLPDVRVCYWADESVRDTDIYSAYFQGILPTSRIYLSNGQHLDCTDEHQVLDAEGSYRTIPALMFGAGALHYYQTTEDYQASYDVDDCPDDQQPLQRPDTGQALPPLSFDAQLHSRQAALRRDEAEHIDQCILASLSGDLRSNSDALRRASDLSDRFSSHVFSPSFELWCGLHQVSGLLRTGEVDLPQVTGAEDLNRISYCDGAGSNRIYFPQPILLMGDVSIIAWHGIGLQPCFDYKIPDFHNYVSAGIISHNCGKSLTGCSIDTFHLTGEYPDDWEGHRFESPPMCWLLGYSGEKTRDLLQHKLFGRFTGGKFEGGLIPVDKIVSGGWRAMTGTAGAMREVRVKHVNGIATCQFWSYSQGQHALMGDIVDWYHIDEEPKDSEIYPQVLTRTLTGDRGRGGRGILTFTPENGKTELVCKFMDEPVPSQYLQTATWDDAPHLTEEMKEAILAQYPPYQRAMRSRGVPLMGAGLIFEHSEDAIKCDPFEIPAHWYLINGMDFGWDHPQAHIQLAWDMGADKFYVIHAYKSAKTQPFEAWEVVKSWADEVPTAWPADGLQTEKGSAKQQKDYYEDSGWDMIDDHATWEEGGMGIEAGLMELNNLMKTGRLKIFSHLIEVFEEIRQYHRVTKPGGRSEIVKILDDLICAIRYAYMMRRHAIQKNDIGRDWGEEDDGHHVQRTNASGY